MQIIKTKISMELIKQLFKMRKDLKKRALMVAGRRKGDTAENGTLQSVLNEALAIGLVVLEEQETKTITK